MSLPELIYFVPGAHSASAGTLSGPGSSEEITTPKQMDHMDLAAAKGGGASVSHVLVACLYHTFFLVFKIILIGI
jgi:hypothetical protein